MEMNKFDVIIIGSGINSLTAASILSKTGNSVQVLEARNEIGGLASTSEFAPGFKCNVINDTIKWIDPRIMKKLDLESKGLELIQPDIVRSAIGNNGEQIDFYLDSNKTVESIAKYSKKDSEKWNEFTSHLHLVYKLLCNYL